MSLAYSNIIKHKLIDQWRRGKREVQFTDDIYDDRSDAEMVNALFTSQDHAVEVKPDWGNPDQTLKRKEFFA